MLMLWGPHGGVSVTLPGSKIFPGPSFSRRPWVCSINTTPDISFRSPAGSSSPRFDALLNSRRQTMSPMEPSPLHRR